MPSQAMQDLMDALRYQQQASANQAPRRLKTAAPHVYQIMQGTPEAAAATGRIGKFLRARVHLDSNERQSSDAS